MICINCFHVKTRVTNSRPHKKRPGVWRRRSCPHCGTVFTTYETGALEQTTVRQHDGTVTEFNLGRLVQSIGRSFLHDKHAARYDSLELARTVELTLLTEQSQPSNDDIAAITHTVLKRYDQLAALQYAAQHDLVTTLRRRGRPAVSYDVSPGPQRQP